MTASSLGNPDHRKLAGANRLSGFGWLASIGPGLVYVLTAMGAGDIVSNATAGATYGYKLIWALGMTLIFRFVWVNVSAKYVLVTGESLLTGYGRVGRWIPRLFMIALLPIGHLAMLYAVIMTGSSATLLLPLPTPWSNAIWACLFAGVGFSIIFWGGYPVAESICKGLVGVLGASLMVAAALSNPDPRSILEGTFIPSMPQAQGLYSAALIMLALIGTEVGSTTNMMYAYFVYEKGWRDVSYLKQQRFDLVVGGVSLFIMGALLQIAAGGIVYPLGVDVEDADDLARIFSETQGSIGLVVFGLGLWGAAFSTFICGNMGRALMFTDICRTFVPRLQCDTRTPDYNAKRDPIYRWVTVFWSFSPLYIVFTGVRPVWLVLMVSTTLVVLIPVLVLSLLKITNDRELMGDYRNGRFTNGVLILLVVVTVYLSYLNLVELWDWLGT